MNNITITKVCVSSQGIERIIKILYLISYRIKQSNL